MEILIHGRKNGYTVLYPKPTPREFYSFASDIQSISANNYDFYYGKNFYTLALVYGGCIFTKYVIGDDVERGQLGEIGISVFIPNNLKLSGTKIKKLLDELINTYNIEYIPNNKIDEPKNGFDWLLFSSLANHYDADLIPCSTNNDNITSGTQDSAFHYYNSDSELIEHFDKPFQEEYSDYRQILFIDSNLQGINNPLNVLKNSGVEVSPDLKNEYFYLNNYNSSKGIKVTAHGKSRSDKNGENQIRANWQVEIKYLKDYYKPIVAAGSISNKDSDIYKYLEINGSNIRIKYEAFLPEPETKTITFDVVTKKDNVQITDADIHIGDYEVWQKISEYTFKAEELGKEYNISARRDNFFSEPVKITPKDFKASSITLPLIEKEIVKIIATEADGEKNNILDFKVWVNNGKCNTQKVSEVTFTGDEIDKTWNITLEKNGYTRSSSMSYCPKNDNSTIYFELKKAPKPTTFPANPQKGESLFDSDGKPKSFAAKANTFFSKSAVIAITIVVILALALVIYDFYDNWDNQSATTKNLLTAQQINAYIDGNSLFINTLNEFKVDWENQKPIIINHSNTSWYNPTTWFVGSNEAISDSSDYKKWNESSQIIEKAIDIRTMINKKNFVELKKVLDYFNKQLSFKTAIEKIDSKNYVEVGQKLGDVSALSLTQIAGEINEILKPIEPVKEEIHEVTKKEVEQPNKNQEKAIEKATIKNTNNNQVKRISEEQQEDFPNNFWKILHKNTAPSKNDFDNWYKTGSEISYANDYKKFYNENLSKSEDFKKFEDFFKKPAMDRKRVENLNDLKKQIK